jgi:hypothetical protein
VDPTEPSDARHAVAPANVALVPWQAGGPLVVGRSDQPGGSTHWLSGSLDNVTAWQGAMTAAAVHTLYAGEAPQVDTEPAG